VKNLTWQNPEQLFVAQVLIKKVKLKCCGIKDMEKGEYAKALSLLEQALPIYRTLEIYNTNYTYQRRNAIEAMIECLEKLGKENLAILYGYELKHLQRDVLDKREKSNT